MQEADSDVITSNGVARLRRKSMEKQECSNKRSVKFGFTIVKEEHENNF
jgi:hypothetical protein